MGYHPRIETSDNASFVTSRARNCELWFANNPELEEYILGTLGKLTERYSLTLYAFALEGDHYHSVYKTPRLNRANFQRDFNSIVARAIPRYNSHYPGGTFWQRRYSGEHIHSDDDIENQFFYTVLQPVQDGLVPKIGDSPYYNCFHDAVWGRERAFKVVNWGAYNTAKRYKAHVAIKDYTEVVTLKYERLPGYEGLSQKEYAKLMMEKLEVYRQEILRQRRAEGKDDFVGREALEKVRPGTPASNPKVSTVDSFRPRVLGVGKNYREGIRWYFEHYEAYQEASKRYRAGDFGVEFPPGMYRPPVWMVVAVSGPFSPL